MQNHPQSCTLQGFSHVLQSCWPLCWTAIWPFEESEVFLRVHAGALQAILSTWSEHFRWWAFVLVKTAFVLNKYLPKKPVKWGTKVWPICNPESSYCYNFSIYTGQALEGQPNVGFKTLNSVSSVWFCILGSQCASRDCNAKMGGVYVFDQHVVAYRSLEKTNKYWKTTAIYFIDDVTVNRNTLFNLYWTTNPELIVRPRKLITMLPTSEQRSHANWLA